MPGRGGVTHQVDATVAHFGSTCKARAGCGAGNMYMCMCAIPGYPSIVYPRISWDIPALYRARCFLLYWHGKLWGLSPGT